MDVLDELNHRVICADGAMGTLLLERRAAAGRCFEELCVTDPDCVARIHGDYLDAGARIIGTNSFGANAARLAAFGLEGRVNELNWTAAQLARQAAKGRDAWVAGCVGPTGVSAAQAEDQGIDREAVLREQIGALLDGGAQLLLFETFQDVEELLLALHIKESLHHCPAICSLAAPESGRFADGTTIAEAFDRLADADADILGLNCLAGPRGMLRLVASHSVPEGIPLAASPNAGRPRYHEGRYQYEASPEYFAETALAIASCGAQILGGCCGTTPEHIAAACAALKQGVPSEPVTVRVPALSAEAAPDASHDEESILDRVARGDTVIITELDPPKTLRLEKYFHAAKELTDAGSDAITLADNSLAILRVGNLAIGAMLKQRGITPLLHVSCRDRNVLGLQSELMGMAAMGIRHVLPLTGDPAKVGDHPGAKSVYDVNSIGLIEMIRRMNEGFTQSGTDLKMKPGFAIGCTFNPNAKNLDAQVKRLERKVAAGAQYVMTQPVFDSALVQRTANATAHLKIPIFYGVWPLLNGRQAKFLHNEVPGITVPQEVLAVMDGAEGPEGRRKGVELAKEVTRAVLDVTPTVYLITPFQVYETTAELAGFIRSL